MPTNVKIQEPSQPVIDFICARYPILKACSTMGFLIIISIIPQALVLFMKASEGTYAFADLFYTIYLYILFATALTMVDAHTAFKNRKSQRVYTFIAKGAKSCMGFALISGFVGIAYTITLKFLEAPHVWAPFTSEMPTRSLTATTTPWNVSATIASAGSNPFGCPEACKIMSNEALVYACMQWIVLFYGGVLMTIAREYTATHKLYTRLLSVVQIESAA